MFAAVVLPLGALGLVGGLYAAFYAPEETGQDRAVVLSEAEEVVSNQLAMRDSDLDGLRDWEETLWETDPHNEDTDGDGTIDGDEIGRGRDPRKAWPDDVLEEHYEIGEQRYFEPSTTTDSTEALAKNFFTEYMALKREGELTPANQQELAQNLAQNIGYEDAPPQYTAGDLDVLARPAHQDRLAYADRVSNSLKKTLALRGNELAVFRLVLEQNQPSMLTRIEAAAATYEEVVENLTTITVPADSLDEHLALVNSIAEMAFIDRKLALYQDDPMASLAAVKNFYTTFKDIQSAAQALNQYFTRNGINPAAS